MPSMPGPVGGNVGRASDPWGWSNTGGTLSYERGTPDPPLQGGSSSGSCSGSTIADEDCEARERVPARITTEYVRACDNWELLVDRTIERTIESTQTCALWERLVAYYLDFDRNREAMHREWEARGWVNYAPYAPNPAGPLQQVTQAWWLGTAVTGSACASVVYACVNMFYVMQAR